MKRFIAFSGGVESTAMCLLYGKGATAIFADTGAEPQEIYDRIDLCELRFKQIHGDDFSIIRLKGSVNIRGEHVDNLPDAILKWKYFPSMTQRYCTTNFKIFPIDNFLKSQGDCELLIGFNADEEPGVKRMGNSEKLKNVKYSYPLFTDGYSREDCEDILFKNGLQVIFPPYMNRGGCYLCFFKRLPELKAFYFFNKPVFDKIRELEEAIQDRRGKPYTAMVGTGMTMKQISELCEGELKIWGENEVKAMYSNIVQSNVCGAFCGR